MERGRTINESVKNLIQNMIAFNLNFYDFKQCLKTDQTQTDPLCFPKASPDSNKS